MPDELVTRPQPEPPPDLPPKQRAILEALRAGNTRTAACQHAGISRETLYAWMRADLTFSDAVQHAEAEIEFEMVDCIRRCAVGGILKKRSARQGKYGVSVSEEYTLPDWQAALAWLRSRKAAWRLQAQLDLRQLTDEQITRLLAGDAETGGDEALPENDASL